MINIEGIFQELGDRIALWCNAAVAGADLALASESVLGRNMGAISVAPSAVSVIWPWLERMPVKIVGRFYLSDGGPRADENISDLTQRINATLKQGASGAQIFVRPRDLKPLTAQLHLIRDDLFFNKELSIGLDIGDVDASDWPDVFAALNGLKANSMVLAMTRDAGDKSDFVGRIYGMLDAVAQGPWRGDLHFALGNNFLRIEQAYRLVQKIRPELLSGIRFFING